MRLVMPNLSILDLTCSLKVDVLMHQISTRERMWDFGLFSTGSLHGSSFREAAYFKISVGNEAKFVLARLVHCEWYGLRIQFF